MVVTNFQQPKIVTLLSTLPHELEQKGGMQEVKITSCDQVAGSEASISVEFPMCKCEDHKASIFCAAEKMLDPEGQDQRKFNMSEVMEHPACKYEKPYCA